MTPADLEKSAARLLHFGVSYSDYRKALEGADLAGMADRYDAMSDPDLWRRAAVYYHYAQFKLRAGDRKDELQRRCRASYAKAASRLDPPAKRIEIRAEGASFAGYLRLWRAEATPPLSPSRAYKSGGAASALQRCVILINGLDSAKEVELHAFAEGFLRRGCAVFYWDGPGQGEGRGTVPMHRYPAVVSAVIDTLDAAAVGVFGVSFGGFLACQAAASDPRIAACVSLGGFHDARIMKRLPPPALENLHLAYGDVPSLEDVITLAPLRGRLQSPLLIVHGTNDHLVDAEQIEALQAWGGALAETRIYEGAEHVCTDRFPEALPALWDWMTETLETTSWRHASSI